MVLGSTGIPLQDYKEWLEEQLPTPDKKDPFISDYRDSSSHEDIKFVIKLSPGTSDMLFCFSPSIRGAMFPTEYQGRILQLEILLALLRGTPKCATCLDREHPAR